MIPCDSIDIGLLASNFKLSWLHTIFVLASDQSADDSVFTVDESGKLMHAIPTNSLRNLAKYNIGTISTVNHPFISSHIVI